MTSPAPVVDAERVEGLDVVRGFALLGILLMNICSFGMPMSAEGNPTVWGGATGVNYWMWWIQYVFWSGKMRALFSLCFGAGVIYLTSRAEAKGASPADVYYRRTLWLLVFGMIHGYLIWYGDILYPYALSALLLFPLRKLPPKALWIIGVAQLAFLSYEGYSHSKEMAEAHAKYTAIPKHAVLPGDVEAARGAYTGFMEYWQPPKHKIDQELRAYRGSYGEAFAHRRGVVSGWTSGPFWATGSWDWLGMMLIGMAIAKTGGLAGSWNRKTYLILAAGGIAVGAALGIWGATREGSSGFDPVITAQGYVGYHSNRLSMALGYMSALVLLVQSGIVGRLVQSLAAVGRMAFSNYIMHSLICTTLFYGHGFGLFGKLERHQLYYVVAAIWAVQLVLSPIWLRHFRFGPLEWAWRSLTYWKWQPMRYREAVISEQSVPVSTPA